MLTGEVNWSTGQQRCPRENEQQKHKQSEPIRAAQVPGEKCDVGKLAQGLLQCRSRFGRDCAALLAFFRRHSPAESLPSAIKGETLGVGGILATVMLLFSSLFSWLVYISADTIFEQIAALLMWIGNCVFWGIFIVISAIHTRK